MNTRLCNHCGKEKSVDLFTGDRKICRTCNREYLRNYERTRYDGSVRTEFVSRSNRGSLRPAKELKDS